MKTIWKKFILQVFSLIFIFSGIYLLIWHPTISKIGFKIETLYYFKNLIAMIGILFGSYISYKCGELKDG